MTTSCTDQNNIFYKQISDLEPFKRKDFFSGVNSNRLKQVSLGEALDFICTGAAMNAVYWDLDSKGLVNFIGAWMNAQDEECRTYFKTVPNPVVKGAFIREKSKVVYNFLWNRFRVDYEEKLPYVDYSECPRDSRHKGVLTNGNITRCSHVDHKFFKPSFIREDGPFLDEHTGFFRPNFYEVEPYLSEGLPSDEPGEEMPEKFYEILYGDQIRKNERTVNLFNTEKATERVTDPCYALISDKGSYLPLETVLDRVNVNNSMWGEGSLFPFSGFTVASYAKAWYHQEGEKIFFTSSGKKDCYKVIPKFEVYSSED